MLSLDQKLIHLVISNDLPSIKFWVKQTNNKNQNYIKETDPDSSQYPIFHYSEIQTLIL